MIEYQKPPAPMTVREAAEAAKILGTYVVRLRESPDPFRLIHNLFDALREEHPVQVFRLLSLYYHTTLEALAETFYGKHPSHLIAALTNGVIANPIPDLVNFGVSVGLLTDGWEKADG